MLSAAQFVAPKFDKVRLMTDRSPASFAHNQHDAFICYSRKDEGFASVLERMLESFRTPVGLPLPQRRLNVFRDKSDFASGDYYHNLNSHLSASAKLIVICSPAARRSVYVNDEIRRFTASRGAANIIPVLLSGLPNNECNPDRTEEQAFPDALCDVLPMPLAVDLRGVDVAKGHLRKSAPEAWYSILASIYEVSRDAIEERERKRLARTRTIAIMVLSGSVAVLSALLVVTLHQWMTARERLQENRRLVYVSDVDFAHEMYLSGKNRVARDAIEKYTRTDELVGFEWRYLWAQSTTPPPPNGTVGLNIIPAHSRLVGAIAFSPDGALLASGSMDRAVRLWDARTGVARDSLLGHPGWITALAFSPDSRSIASGSNDSTVRLWDIASRRSFPPLRAGNVVTTVAFSPDGQTLAMSGRDPSIILWNVGSIRRGSARADTLSGHWNQVMELEFAPNGRLLASSGWDRMVRLWHVGSKIQLDSLPGHASAVFHLAFSPDSETLFTGSLDSAVIAWDIAGAREAGRFTLDIDSVSGTRTTGGEVRSVAVSPNGRTLALSVPGAVELWDIASRRPLVTIPSSANGLRKLRFSPNGIALAGGDSGGAVWLWQY